MRGNTRGDGRPPFSLSITLDFTCTEFKISAQVVKREVRFLCDDSCFLVKGWLMEHHKEVLEIVRQQVPYVDRIKIFVDSHTI